MNRHEDLGCALVVGATGAVGGAIVERLRTRTGLPVVAVARNRDRLAQLARADHGVIACVADIGAPTATAAIADALPGNVRIAVQAAGLPATGHLDAIDPDALGQVVSLKLGGLLRMIRAIGHRWAPDARIVAVGGHFGSEPTPQTCAAGVTNAALANLVRQLADSYGPRGATVHLLAPGPLDSDRLRRLAAAAAQSRGLAIDDVLDEYRAHSPLGRLTTLGQVAWAVEQLLAPEAEALHGSTLALDGGARRGLF